MGLRADEVAQTCILGRMDGRVLDHIDGCIGAPVGAPDELVVVCGAVGAEPGSGPVDETGATSDADETRIGVVELADPSPAQARRAASTLAAAARLGPDATSGLLLAVSEIVTNAHLHGSAPVVVRMWRSREGVTVTVRDAGPGPGRPVSDHLPAPDAVEGGRGCWLARRSVTRYEARADDAGYVVLLSAATAPH